MVRLGEVVGIIDLRGSLLKQGYVSRIMLPL
jgi:hypothetical protein